MDDTISGRPANEPSSFAIIIGGMKCGTTSLFELLAQHPEVAPSRVKEPDFFASEPDPELAWPRYAALWDWDPRCHKVALEASTSYAKYPWVKDVPERMAAVPGCSFKFIYMTRDPVQRIASQVRHGLYDGWGRSLDEAGLTDDLVDFSRYAAQLDRYSALFPRSSILLLTLEDLQRDPQAVLRRTCVFLGISSDHEFVGLAEPRNTGDFYNVAPTVAVLARNRLAKWLVNRLLPSRVQHYLRKKLAKAGARDPATLGRWQLDEREIERVRGLLADDMTRLSERYGARASWLPPYSPQE